MDDPTGSGRWARVFAKFDDDSGGVLAGVLANPLMLWLARVVYDSKSPDRLTLFGSRESLENHLLDEFIPAVYAADPRWPIARQFRCTVQQAERWLGHLFWDSYVEHEIGRGRQADADRTPGLAWWRLSQVAGRWRLLGIALRAAVLCGVALEAGQASRDLAPAAQWDAQANGPKRRWPALSLTRLWEEREVRWHRKATRIWSGIVRYRRSHTGGGFHGRIQMLSIRSVPRSSTLPKPWNARASPPIRLPSGDRSQAGRNGRRRRGQRDTSPVPSIRKHPPEPGLLIKQ